MRIGYSWLTGLAALSLVAACAKDDTEPTATTTTTTTTTSSGGSAPVCVLSAGAGGMSCTPPGFSTTKTETLVNTVTADVVDLASAPAADVVADVCGFNICYSGSSDASGHISVNAKNDGLEVPRLLYGDGIEYVRLQSALPAVPDAAFGTIHIARLPSAASGAVLAPGAEASSGGVTLSLAADAFVTFDVLLYCKQAEQTFRAVQIPLDAGLALPGVDATLGLGLLFGMAPVGTQICPRAQMTVANSAGWTPGATVEFYFQGISLFEEYAPYGGWAKVSEGTVSGDGATVSTNGAEGIPELGVIGIRLKP